MKIDDDRGAATKGRARHQELHEETQARGRSSASNRHQRDLQNVRMTGLLTETDADASAHWQALKAAKTPEAEIERYNKLRNTTRTMAEAEHDEDLHKLRMRRFSAKRRRCQDAVREVACVSGAEQASRRTQRYTSAQDDPDFALALQLQEEEYAGLRETEQRQARPIEEKEQTRQYNEQHVKSRIESLEQHMAHIRNVRDSMIRELRSGIALETGQQLGPDQERIASPGPRRRGRGTAFEQKAPPSPSSDIPESSRAPLVIHFSSGHVDMPSLKLSDSEVFKVPAKPPSPPPKTQWRYRTTQRGQLNLDFSRIETHFILAPEFIHDTNTMLDVIGGWSSVQIKDIEYAFKKDIDNSGRSIEFVKIDNWRWGVRLLNPRNPERRDALGMLCPFRSSDNPQNICQSLGSKYCSNEAYTKERFAAMISFRKKQNMLPPPLPLRSDKRKPSRSSQGARPPEAPATPLRPVNTPRLLESTRETFLTLSEEDMRPDRIENMELDGSSVRRKLDQVKSFMSQIEPPSEVTQDTQAEGRERVRKVLQGLNLTPKTPEQINVLEQPINLELSTATEQPQPSKQPETSERPNSYEQPVRHHRNGDVNSIPSVGKLIHKERIPSGPNSLRSEDLSSTAVASARRGRPYGQWAMAVHKKPREQYYAAASTITDQSSSGDDTPSPQDQKQSSIDSAMRSAISSLKPKLTLRPQYLKHPDAY